MKGDVARWFCLLGLTPLLGNASPDPQTVAAFEQGNRLYEEGQFVDAIQTYRPLLTNAPNAALRFNLGNAYFKSGQLGEAIAEYRLSERLAPRDPDLRANLGFARDRVPGPSFRPSWLRQQSSYLTTDEWTLVITVALWLVLGLLITQQCRPAWRSALRPWTLVAAILAVLATASGMWISRERSAHRIAVVTQRDAVMRLGPFEESQSALDLKNGAELRVLDQKEDWIQVTPDNRQLGWVPTGSVRLLDP
jgi:tetratricopeptide (TPR) repeat protein